MRILIFGATGATGTLLVGQALERGHSVTAFVRDPARLRQAHESLRTITGDVMVPASIEAAVQSQDAVLCALGTMTEIKADRARRQRGVPVCSTGTLNITRAMTRYAVRRIVIESSVSVGDSAHTGRFGAGTILRLLLRDVMQDKERQEASVRASGLDWTIIRPVKLSDAPRSGEVASADGLTWGLLSKIPRADVAAVMLDALSDSNTLHRAITVRGCSRAAGRQ